ncbi:HAD family hydrolase [Qipengyuania huizhouensis]|uniref:HAD family hydrolase n=1 Tax=Qipengyuania huizhouensis TaxID=2867245 RepID=UPI001C8810E4|nr:HAD-IB family phosphatase [Qipengyuania huizhouensis]MBX7461006.1 HAD-IB family phosphatase [Qipengyuania huizhouensis]
MKVAIYDLDKTLVRRATFTPFLLFAAQRLAPVRVLLFPVWIAMMIGYRIGLYDRTRLKTMGMHLMLGRQPVEALERAGREFATHHLRKCGWVEGVIAMLETDRKEGAHLVIATAAFEFYARGFAEKLGIEDVIATGWDGEKIPGGNCYGDEKRKRVALWLDDKPAGRKTRFVSDSFADAPLLQEADDPVFVTQSASKRKRAETNGWRVIGWSD